MLSVCHEIWRNITAISRLQNCNLGYYSMPYHVWMDIWATSTCTSNICHFCVRGSIHLLLGDHISEEELQRAESLLDSFYEQFARLYGEGSCGLNVHNIGAHLVFYVRMWGPLWAWSCFPFEDWNAALLQSVHGTGDVTKQCLRMKEFQLKLSCIDLNSLPRGATQEYLRSMKRHDKSWKVTGAVQNVTIAGSLKSLMDLPGESMQFVLQETGSLDGRSLQKALRVRVNDQKLYSKEYARMKKRICYVVQKWRY